MIKVHSYVPKKEFHPVTMEFTEPEDVAVLMLFISCLGGNEAINIAKESMYYEECVKIFSKDALHNSFCRQGNIHTMLYRALCDQGYIK